jgi:O-antigen/teichoic acid export membrane protein
VDVLSRGVQGGAMFLLAALCTKEQYGSAGILLAVQQVIAVLVVSGLIESTTLLLNEYRSKAELPKLFAHARMLLLFTAAAVSLSYLAAAKTILPSYVRGTSFLVHVSVLLTGVFIGRLSLNSNLHRLDERHRESLFLKAMPIVLCYGVGIAGTLLLRDKLTGFFVGSLVGAGIAEALTRWVSRDQEWDMRYSVDGHTLRRLALGARHMLPIIVVNWLVGYGANFMIGRKFSKSDIAEFTFAVTLNSLLLLTLNSINQVWSPRFFKVAHERASEELESLNSLMSTAMLLLVSVVIGAILLFYVNALNLLGGNLRSYSDLHPYLFLTFSSFILLTLYFRCINYFYLYGKQYIYMNIFVLSGMVGLACWWLMMKYMGRPGIYAGYFLCIVLRSLSVFWYARKKWGVRISAEEIPATLMIAAAGYAFAVGISGVLLRSLLFMVVVCCITYFLWFMNRKALLSLKLLRV